ncbi:MAG: hypothetical protein ACRCTZ_00315 [Sarcina sp.]
MKGKYYDDNNEELSQIANKESMISKFVKAGIVTTAVYATSGKAKGTKLGNLLSSDIAKYGAIAGGTYALSSDDNIGGDITSASSFVLAASGVKALKSLNQTPEGFVRVQNLLKKADEIEELVSLKAFNFADKVKEEFGKNMAERMKDSPQPDKNGSMFLNGLKSLGNLGKTLSLATYDTVTAPMENIKKFGVIEGLKRNIEAINDTQAMGIYKQLPEQEKQLIKNLSNITKGFTKTDVLQDEAGFIASKLDTVSGMLGMPNLFTLDDPKMAQNIEMLKKLDKIDSIKNNTTFSDMGGLYTKFDVGTGKAKLDIAKLGSSESSNIELLESLAIKFEKSTREDLGKTVSKIPGTDEKVFHFKYDKLNSEEKEILFVDYLNKNGFKDFVDNNYKKNGALTVGDVDDMFRGKSLQDNDHLNNLQQITETQFKAGRIDEEKFLSRMAMINEKRENMADQDIIDYVNNSLSHNNLKKFVEVDADNGYSKGVKNAHILKNFTFTNVVEKSDDFGFIDKTALDGSIMSMKMLGILEKNFVGFFKTPFTKQLNRWNPLKLAETEGRIKDIVANEYNPYGVTKNGFFLNGKIIQSKEYDVKEIVDGKKGPFKRKVDFFTDEKDTHKRTFMKSTIDMLDDNYEVTRENVKEHNTYKQVWETYKSDGFKAAMERASESHFNPLPIRYKKGEGIRGVDPKDSYFNEEPIWSGIYNNNLKDSSVINYLDRKGKETGVLRKTANLVLGDNGDINGRLLQLDNDFVEARYENMVDYSISAMFEQGKRRYNAAVSDPAIMGKFFPDGVQTPEKVAAFQNAMKGSIDALKYSDIVYGSNMPQLKGQLKELADKNQKFMNNIDYLEGLMSSGQVSGTNIFKAIGAEPEHKDFMKFIGENANEFNRFFTLGDYKFSSNQGFRLEDGSSFDLNNVTNEFKRLFSREIEGIGKGSDIYHSMMKRLIETTETAEDWARGTNVQKGQYILNGMNFDDTDDLSNVFRKIDNFVKSVDTASDKAANDMGKELLRGQLINDTKVGKRVNDLLKNRDFSTPELKDAYNLNLGYGYNRVLSDEDNASIFKTFNKMSKDFKNVDADSISWEKSFAIELANTNKHYSKSGLGVSQEVMSGVNSNDINRSYSFFDGLDDAANIEPNSKLGYLEVVNKLRSMKRVGREEQLGSSIIIEDTAKNMLSIQSALEVTRKFVQSFIDKNKKGWYNFSGLTRYGDDPGIIKRNYQESFKFGDIDSTFGLFMKKAINQVQGPLEFIGVERITNEALGSHWTDQYKNFMKYRYLPLAALATGYLAADSATDAIVPDDVPIFGNGLTGVATRGYATARVGLQYGLKYTGALSLLRAVDEVIPVDNGLTWFLDPLMDPGEMIDVYFHGKAVRVNKNRNWYTAGRQTGEGEEFGQYRPHLLYTIGNPTAGIYDNKFEKLFRQDMLLTKYPWYLLDPYKEERDAYEKFGALYPKTEQMFKDVPLLGHLLSATVGEVIKPTQYIGEELWKVGDNLMKNPGYNPNDPTSPEYIEFKEPNKMLTSFFDAVEDYKTFSGMHGYLFGKMTEAVFGGTSPYTDNVVLDSIDNDTNMISRYERLELGGMFGTTEGIRRLLDGDSLGLIEMNPLEQKLPDWMPEFFKKGKNPYMKSNFGEYTLPGEAFEDSYNGDGNQDLDQLRVLSMHAPFSKPFTDLKAKIFDNFGSLSDNEKRSYYESLSYAGDYGKREFNDKDQFASNVVKKSIMIDKKLSATEFMSGGVRYKIDNINSNFNEISENIGSKRAARLLSDFNNKIQEGSEYSFNVSENAVFSVGMDNQGDFVKVGSDLVHNDLKGNSVYNRQSGIVKSLLSPISLGFNKIMNAPMPSHLEKVFGKKTAYQEWSQETVQAPYFRDWDSPVKSFVEPFFNYSSNSLASSMMFGSYVGDSFINSNATFDALGMLVTAGKFNLAKNSLLGTVTRSSEYDDESVVHNELEKIKAIAGDKSYYNMNGQENMMQFKNMVSENDSVFLDGLINTTSVKERAQILNTADEITGNVLKTIWNRHQKLIGNENSDNIYEIEKDEITDVVDIGAYIGDADQARLALKTALNVDKSKLDNKRIGVISSYRGGMALSEADYIRQRMYKGYNSKSVVTSTIYPKGTINVTRREN